MHIAVELIENVIRACPIDCAPIFSFFAVSVYNVTLDAVKYARECLKDRNFTRKMG